MPNMCLISPLKSVFINYIDRGNLATAVPLMQDELHLSPSELGVLLSAFYYGYVPCMPATGWLAERFQKFVRIQSCRAASGRFRTRRD